MRPRRAEMVEEVAGRPPKVTGVLSRKQGDFDEILAASDVIVELIGGIDPARDYVTRALKEGRHVVTANKQLVAQHGDELVAVLRRGRWERYSRASAALGNDTVFALTESRHVGERPAVWVGTRNGGVSRWDGGGWRRFARPSFLVPLSPSGSIQGTMARGTAMARLTCNAR